ncbi:uncharacterized protein TEOVI_000380000 [Trypanosoma equiperdum]|uniref:Uncharacterized protein n=1 Tax=Trypanosoma equiperdum TaxID=5694 RepID=A0A1G4IIG7_TRYEQ|nr:hypothetical protein, conserved [Trypanosoma equiperdum]
MQVLLKLRQPLAGCRPCVHRCVGLIFDSPMVEARLASSSFSGRNSESAILFSKGPRASVASSVKHMVPPPQRQPQTTKPVTSSPPNVLSGPLPAVGTPLLDAGEITTEVAAVLVMYRRHLNEQREMANGKGVDLGEAIATTTADTWGGVTISAPFYPPVPLEYMEEHFQPLLSRLVPGAGSPVRLVGAGVGVEHNKQLLTSRIQSTCVFTLSPSSSRTSLDGKISPESRGADEKLVIRVRPGVRELATEIAALVRTLEASNGCGERRPVPLKVIHRASLSHAATSFIRRELSNDIKRLLLVYECELFAFSSNGSVVRVRDGCGMGSARGAESTTVRSEAASPTQSHHVPVNSAPSPPVGEAHTVMHMGERIIAPSSMERYRLSQSLLPLLQFIQTIPVSSTGMSVDSDGHGFVDFAAVRNRVLAAHPSLTSLFVLNREDVRRRREVAFLSALSTLGVEWCWGRPLAECQQRKTQHQGRQSPHLESSNEALSDIGVLFLRRRLCAVPEAQVTAKGDMPPTGRLPHSVVLRELSDEGEVADAPVSRLVVDERPWWSFVSYWQGTAPDPEENVDMLDRLFCGLQAAVYEKLEQLPSARLFVQPLGEDIVAAPSCAMYPMGACANIAFVRHLMRYFTTRQHEALHPMLIGEVQGRVSPLVKNEIKENIACLFFPYEECSAQRTGSHIGAKVDSGCGACGDNATKYKLIVFNRFVDGCYKTEGGRQVLYIRARATPGEPPLASRKKLPAKLVLEVMCCLHRELLRRAEEIGMDFEDDVDESDESNRGDGSGDGSCLSFAVLRTLLPIDIRVFIRDHIGDPALIPLLVVCHPRYFFTTSDGVSNCWGAVGLTCAGRRLARHLEETSDRELGISYCGNQPSPYRNPLTGSLFMNNTRQQLESFLICH